MTTASILLAGAVAALAEMADPFEYSDAYADDAEAVESTAKAIEDPSQRPCVVAWLRETGANDPSLHDLCEIYANAIEYIYGEED